MKFKYLQNYLEIKKTKNKVISLLFLFSLFFFLVFSGKSVLADYGLMNGKQITGASDNYILWLQSFDPDKLNFNEAYSDILFVNKAGNVGIGTSSPSLSAKLETQGLIKMPLSNVSISSGSDVINKEYLDSSLGAIDLSGNYWSLFGNVLSSKTLLGSNNSQDIGLKTAGVERLTVSKDGNIGIGALSPANKLEILAGVRDGLAVNGGGIKSILTSTGLEHYTTGSGNYSISNNLRKLSDASLLAVISGAYGGANSLEYLYYGGSSYDNSVIYIRGLNLGVNTNNPKSKFDVLGNVSIGSYAGINAAPSNGLIVSGRVGINTPSPLATAQLHVDGLIKMSGTNITDPKDVINREYLEAALDSEISGAISGIDFWKLDGTKLSPSSTDWNIGIGTANPSKRLDVVGDIQASEKYYANNIQVINHPGGNFSGSLFFGTGGLNLSHSSGSQGKDNTGLGIAALFSNTSGHSNTASGFASLYSNTTGYANTANGHYTLYNNEDGYANLALGVSALFSNISGHANIAVGPFALHANTSGYGNTASGLGALYSNTSGYGNAAFGLGALYSNTTGYANLASGLGALYSNTDGYANVASGLAALYSNTGGYENVAIGANAARYLANGSSPRVSGNYGVYLGSGTKSAANNTTNEIVIGYNTIGAGSNSIVLGNDSIAKTLLKGNVGIGLTNPASSLDVAGMVKVRGAIVDNIDIITKEYLESAIGDIAIPDMPTDYWKTTGNSVGTTKQIFGTLSNASIGFRTNNTERLTMLNTGNIGIGNTNPTTAKLYVDGVIKMTGTNIIDPKDVVNKEYLESAIGDIAIPDMPTDYWKTGGNSVGTTKQIFGTLSNASIGFRTNNIERLTMLNTGFIGIGKTNPAVALDVTGTVRMSNNPSVATDLVNRTYLESVIGAIDIPTDYWKTGGNSVGTTKQIFGTLSNASIGFRTNNAERLTILNTGFIGIGKTNPAVALDVTGTVRASNAPSANTDLVNRAYLESTVNGLDSSFWALGGNSVGTTKQIFGTTSNASIGFRTNNAERLTILDTGNVGIGNTNPTTAKLHVDGIIKMTGTNITDPKDVINREYLEAALDSEISGAISGIDFWKLDGTKLSPSSTDWNIGIGTANPSKRLDVVGDIQASEKYYANNIQVINHPGGNFSGSLFFGTGGLNLSHSSGSQGKDNTGLGIAALFSNTSGHSNTASGFASLYSNTTGYANTANGHYTLYNNEDGYANLALGVSALFSNISGHANIAVGPFALHANTSGYGNTASGLGALYSNTSGYGNAAFGLGALYSNTTGYANLASGLGALYSNTGGYGNTAIGVDAARYLANGSSPRVSGNYGVYLGSGTMALSDNTTNEIVIGYNAAGAGSNSVVLGNDSIAKTLLKGNVGIGLTNPASSLDVAGMVKVRGAIVDDLDVITKEYLVSAINNIDIPDMSTDYWKTTGNAVGTTKQIFGTTSNASIGFRTNNIERLTMLNTGFIGIGKTNPAVALDVAGTIRMSNNPSAATDLVNRTYLESAIGAIDMSGDYWKTTGNSVGTTKQTFGTTSNASIGLVTNNAERLTILNTGNVGIGNTSPTEGKLVISHGGAAIRLKDVGGANAYVESDNTWGMKWKFAGDSDTMEMNSANTAWQSNINSGGVTRFRWNTTKVTSGFTGAMVDFNVDGTNIFYGKVGIAKTNPAVALDVAGTIRMSNNPSAATDLVNKSYLDSSLSSFWSLGGNSVGTTKQIFGTTSNADIGFRTNNVERLTIVKGGNVGIGITNPSKKFEVSGDIGASGRYYANNTQALYNPGGNFTGSFFLGTGGASLSHSSGTSQGKDNTGLGIGALFSNTRGYSNTASGASALYSNNTGFANTAVGHSSLYSNTAGYANVGVGSFSLYSNTNGYANSAFGIAALHANTSGYANTASGLGALYSNTSGYANTAIGLSALYANTTGNSNTALGVDAARYLSDDWTVRTGGSEGLYLGAGTKSAANNTINEIVIGYNAVGAGTNSVVLGNSDIEKTLLKGKVAINLNDPGAYALKVGGNAAITGTMQTQTGSDFAEEFISEGDIEPATVVIMSDLNYKAVKQSNKAYDTKVVGVVSDNPSIIAGYIEAENKVVVALAGVVSVKVETSLSKIKAGDLLTSSSLAGYAMKANEFIPGTVIGKALEDFSAKKGSIKVLVNLQ